MRRDISQIDLGRYPYAAKHPFKSYNLLIYLYPNALIHQIANFCLTCTKDAKNVRIRKDMKVRISHRLTFLLYIVCASLLLLFVVACNDQQQTSSNDSNASVPSTGNVGSTLVTPDNSAFTLIKSNQSGSHLFLHFHINNKGSKELDLLGKGPLYQIKITANRQSVLATLPTAAESHLYPALPTKIASGQTVDGWVSVESASLKGASLATVEYVFDQIATKACTQPNNPSTCKPASLDKSLLWYLQNK